MNYSFEDIEKILGFTSWSDRKKIDTLLEVDANLYCNLGKESSKTEVEKIKVQSRKIYRAIKTIDKYWGGMMLRENIEL